jgi:hypothetical protein
MKVVGHGVYTVVSEALSRTLHDNFLISVKKIERRLAHVRRIFQEERADIVLMAADVPTWDTGIFIRAARMEGIPSIVCFSQTGPLDEATIVASKKWYLSTRLPMNFIAGKLYGKWVNERNGKQFLMMGAGKTLARELLGVTMAQPWIESSSNADAVIIENEAYLSRGRRAGLSAKNLYVTGCPFHDVLYSGLSRHDECLERIYSVHKIRVKKPIVLTSLLPNYQGRDNSESDFGSYAEMVSFWIGSLVHYDEYHTMVSLHPSQKVSEFSYIGEMGAIIARLPISEMMPACHIYVASLSSTITMALACGKPVINYDFAHYRNTHYEDAAGVIVVETRDEFRAALDRLLRNDEYYASVARAQSKDARRWGNVDGEAGKRILQLIAETMAKCTTAKRVARRQGVSTRT